MEKDKVDVDTLKNKTKDLQDKAMELAGRVYQEAGAQANASSDNNSSDDSSSDTAEEAEFVDKK